MTEQLHYLSLSISEKILISEIQKAVNNSIMRKKCLIKINKIFEHTEHDV